MPVHVLTEMVTWTQCCTNMLTSLMAACLSGAWAKDPGSMYPSITGIHNKAKALSMENKRCKNMGEKDHADKEETSGVTMDWLRKKDP